jgi:hypothetical protein
LTASAADVADADNQGEKGSNTADSAAEQERANPLQSRAPFGLNQK